MFFDLEICKTGGLECLKEYLKKYERSTVVVEIDKKNTTFYIYT